MALARLFSGRNFSGGKILLALGRQKGRGWAWDRCWSVTIIFRVVAPPGPRHRLATAFFFCRFFFRSNFFFFGRIFFRPIFFFSGFLFRSNFFSVDFFGRLWPLVKIGRKSKKGRPIYQIGQIDKFDLFRPIFFENRPKMREGRQKVTFGKFVAKFVQFGQSWSGPRTGDDSGVKKVKFKGNFGLWNAKGSKGSWHCLLG